MGEEALVAEIADVSLVAPAQQTLKMQLPHLEDELQRAIDSLRKLQSITGSLSGERPGSPDRIDLRTPLADAGLSNLAGGAPPRPLLEPRQPSDRAPAAQQIRILVAGETFGRYQITRPLGKGAMGAVYLAYDPQLQRYIALKTPFLGDNPQVVQRFLREARSAAQIRSPYVCPIYEVDNVAGILYLSMAFIEGQSLAKWITTNSHTPWTRLSRSFARFLWECRRPTPRGSFTATSSPKTS
jgi:serine/threonine protein kinase